MKRGNVLRAATLAVLAWMSVLGCVGYAPGIAEPEEQQRRVGWAANPALDDVARVALSHVLTRHPPKGEYAVSFPQWMSETRARSIVSRLDAEGAHILTPETIDFPVYHVAWVRVVGDEATAHIHRPVLVSEAGGAIVTVTQAYDVRCRGGLHPWSVSSVRAWGLGAFPEPPRNAIGESPEPVRSGAEQ